MYVGIDVGHERIHAVRVDNETHLVDAGVFDALDPAAVVAWSGDARVVAIDAPAARSTRPHSCDPPSRRSAKFAPARCAEIHLGEAFGIWVPWVAPCQGDDCPGWMTVGFALFAAFSAAGTRAIETYPHGAFRVLAGRTEKLLPKRTRRGAARRVELLRAAGLDERHLDLWSHDSLDAAVAAIVARDHAARRAQEAGCGHDGSRIWLPATADQTTDSKPL